MTTDPSELQAELRAATGPHAAHVIASGDRWTPPPQQPLPISASSLELTDVDGDRIRFRLYPGTSETPVNVETAGPVDADDPDWLLRVALTVDQLREVVAWGAHVLGISSSVLAAAVGRPYTDDEQRMLDAIRSAHRLVTAGAIDDEYQRGRAHALDDVARVLLPRLHSGRPYTDEELARGPSPRRDTILREQLDRDADRVRAENADLHAEIADLRDRLDKRDGADRG